MNSARYSLGLTGYVAAPAGDERGSTALLSQPEPAQTSTVEVDLDIEVSASAITADQAAAILGKPVQRTIPSTGATHLMAQPGGWDWEAMRDYVIGEIERRFGPSPRNPAKESGIFKGFINRHGSVLAEKIARAAFEVHNGMWRGAPIGIGRFSQNSDPYFASIIASTITS